MKSRLFSSGVAINSICLLLLLSVYFTSIVVLSVSQNPYSHRNWIEQSKKSWPNYKTGSAPFLVFHSEYNNGNFLKLNKSVWNDQGLTYPDLSFTYWTSDQVFFRSQEKERSPPEKNIKLNPENDWKLSEKLNKDFSSSLKSITKKQWENFGFENTDVVTLGLKDVSVKYVEKIDTSNADQFTAYPVDGATFKMVNFTVATDASNRENTVNNDNLKFDNDKISVTGKTVKIKDLKNFTFKKIIFELQENGQIGQTHIEITAQNNICNIIPTLKQNWFTSTKCSSNVIEELKITVEKSAFTISKFKGFKKDKLSDADAIQKTPKDLKPFFEIPSPPPVSTTGKTYKTTLNEKTLIQTNYVQVKGYIQLNETRPLITEPEKLKKDTCYTITKKDSLTLKSSVDVYFTLEKAQVGFKLNSITENDNAGKKTICLFDYLALQNIDKYMITLVAQGEVTKDFSINVVTQLSDVETSNKKLFAPDSANIDLASLKWLYYNSIFENVFTTVPVDSEADLYACDVISSCYPLQPTENNPSNFALSDKLKNELNKSPFFQIRGFTKPNTQVKFVTSTTEQSQKAFNNAFINDNPSSLTSSSVDIAKNALTTANDFVLMFTNPDKTSTVTLSLDSIDMRFQKLKMNIELVKTTGDTKSELLFKSITLQRPNENEWSFSPDLVSQNAKVAFDKFEISSDDLFVIRPTGNSKGNKITFTLQLNPDVPKTPYVKVKFTVEAKSVGLTTTNITSLDKLDLIHKANLETVAAFSLETTKKTRYIYTKEFIDNSLDATLGKTGLKMEMKITTTGTSTKVDNYQVYRVVADQATLKYSIVHGKPDVNSNKAVIFSDGVKNNDFEIVKGPFRVLYIIHSKDSVKNNVVVTKFEVGNQEINDKNSNKGFQSVAQVDLRFEQAVCVYGIKVNNVCELPSFNQITEIKCNMETGCNNIFDRQLPTSVMDRSDSDNPIFVPFKLAGGKREEHQLMIHRKPTTNNLKPDFCINLKYLAKSTALQVTDDSDSPNIFELPLTPDSTGQPTKYTVCASYFTENVENVNSLIFYFANPELDIDHHYVQFDNQVNNQDGNKDLVLLDGRKKQNQGIYISDLKDEYFFPPLNHWKTFLDTNTLFKNGLTFTISHENLETLNANGKDSTSELYYETLRSRWIKMPAEGASLKYGLTFNSVLSKDNNTIVVNEKTVVRIISSRTASKVNLLTSFKTDAVTTLDKALPAINDNNKKLTEEHYRLEIEIVLNVTKIKDVLKKKNQLKPEDDLLLVVENLNINDPCIVGKTVSTLQKCNPVKDNQGNIKGLNDNAHNWCERGYNVSIFGPICHCISSFTGNTCENKNYCKTQGFAICGEERLCKNDEEFKQVKCDCKQTGEKWNPFLKNCINPAELTKCGENRRPQYTSVPRGIQCVCIEDYIEVSLNATTKVCVPFEPCNKEHRKNLSIKIPCPNANTTCQPTGSKTQPEDFQCNCDTGFININEVRTSEAKCLPDVCAKCFGNCKPIGKVYNCDPTFCDSTGYDFNSITKECKFNGTKFAKLLGCDKQGLTAILGNDKKPACKCAKGQKLDLNSRLCLNKCDETAVNACKERGASSCEFENGKAQCKCSSTELPYAKANASDWKCISKCSLLEMPDFYEARCGNSFEHCIENGNLPIKPLEDAANSPYITGVFISNITKINIDEAVKNGIDEQKEYCACDLGFIWEKTAKKCFPSTIPTHTISGFEFDLIPTHNLTKYIEDVENAFTNLVAAVIGLDKKKKPNMFKNLKRATKCEKADEKSILCRTSFQSTMTNEQITKKLASACVPTETDKSKCFYVVNPTNTFLSNFITKSAIDDTNFTTYGSHTNSFSQDNNVLVHNPSINPKVTKEEYCSKNKNTCSSYAYSVCKDDETKPFECLCPVKEKSFFKVIDSKKLSLTENGKTIDLRMETCGIHNMCKVDKDNFGCKFDDALCHFQVELDDVKKEYFGVSYCTCPTGIILSDRSLSCQESCNGFCSNNTASCGKDYLNTKKVICNCKDGFTGSKCEKKAAEAKKEAEASSSKAYLISTIVVSVIAAIALIGLAVLYFKRR